jgi:hypothetical protein
MHPVVTCTTFSAGARKTTLFENLNRPKAVLFMCVFITLLSVTLKIQVVCWSTRGRHSCSSQGIDHTHITRGFEFHGALARVCVQCVPLTVFHKLVEYPHRAKLTDVSFSWHTTKHPLEMYYSRLVFQHSVIYRGGQPFFILLYRNTCIYLTLFFMSFRCSVTSPHVVWNLLFSHFRAPFLFI